MENQKKILAIFGNVALFGQERANIQVFNMLKEAGFDVLLVVNRKGFRWHLQPEIEQRNLNYIFADFPWNFRKTLNLKAIKSMMVNSLKCNLEVRKIIKSYKPDVIHLCNDNHVLALVPTLLFTKTKIVYRLGDKPSAHLSFIHKILWKYAIIPKINKFVCISNFIKDELLKVGAQPKQIEIIYNYPPQRPNTALENLPKVSDDLLTFTFIGQISKDKGIHLLVPAFIELFKIHKNCRLLIAGDMKQNRDLVNALQKMIFDNGMENEIIFLGKVNNIMQLFSITDINVIPSLYQEPLSNVIVEAKAYSTPSIVFNSGGLPELVDHLLNGYIVTDKTIEGLLTALVYYSSHKDEIEHQGQNAFNSINDKKISYQDFKRRWLNIYG